jgi:DNA-binding NtrC family response regulator
MMAMSQLVDVPDLPASLQRPSEEGREARLPLPGAASQGPGSTNDSTKQSLEEHEKQLVTEALAEAGGNQSQAARRLRIGRDALRYKMKKYGLM